MFHFKLEDKSVGWDAIAAPSSCFRCACSILKITSPFATGYNLCFIFCVKFYIVQFFFGEYTVLFPASSQFCVCVYFESFVRLILVLSVSTNFSKQYTVAAPYFTVDTLIMVLYTTAANSLILIVLLFEIHMHGYSPLSYNSCSFLFFLLLLNMNAKERKENVHCAVPKWSKYPYSCTSTNRSP